MPGFSRVPAGQAFQVAIRNKVGAQPRASSGDPRIERYASPAFRPTFSITPGESVFTIGSCFARGIEHFLQKEGFAVPTMELQLPAEELDPRWPRPTGVLNKYTPFSMINEVRAAFEETDIEAQMIESEDGLYLDCQLHSEKPVPLSRAVERRIEINSLNRRAIETSRVVIITLGLIEAWFDSVSELYTNFTPSLKLQKRHPERFWFEMLSPEITIDAVTQLVRLLRKYGREDQKLLLTVSPVPIGRTFSGQDVLVANSYSKAVLRAAAEVVVRAHDHVDYFPSYETVMLSDPVVAWMEDRIHVQYEMVRHNAMNMLAAYVAPASTARPIFKPAQFDVASQYEQG
jgi:hypothetical protein